MVSVSIINLEERSVVEVLCAAREQLEPNDAETVLDFSLVRRLDSRSLAALREFTVCVGEKQGKVTLRGLNVEVYKALKLARLTETFSFID